ncbi:MAG: UDP-N-acetylmuramoyl-tripeptide--D-alanyl-D-alanine ligase, partial [Planctomycetaceae bacterium]
ITFDRVSIDSRTLRAGDLFWAIRGETHDGHDYIGEAVKRGAVASVVRNEIASSVGRPAIAVPDTLDALGKFARWYRDRQEALVIGVTGSVGKTTTREMIHAVLQAGFRGTKSQRNYNNHVGLPLCILDIEKSHEFAVLEMGASRIGEIRDLARIAAPEIGVITKIGLAHLSSFGSEKQIVQAKGELVEAIPPSGFAVLSGDDARSSALAARTQCPVIYVGENTQNNVRATSVSVEPERLKFRVDGKTYEVMATGRHHLTAALAAIAIAREVGMENDAISEGLRSFEPVAGRCRLETIGTWSVIDDTYNANPSSMQAACEVLRTWKGDAKKLLIAGDMLELGTRTVECHRELGRQAAASGLDHLIVFGEQSEHVVRGARESGMDPHRMAQCETLDSLLTVLDCWVDSGAMLLVKGSRGMRMERVLEWLREHKEQNVRQHTARTPARACA